MRIAPRRAITPTKITLLRGTRLLGSMAPKNFFGIPLLRPLPEGRASRSELRAEAGADVGDQNREIQKLEKEKSAGGLRDEGKGRLDFVGRERGGTPDELRGVNLERGENPGDEADQNGGQHDIAAGIFDFFGKSGDGVETDIGEDGDRSAAENPAEAERGRIVERVCEKSGTVGMHVPEKPDHEGKEDHDYDAHAASHHVIDARGGLDASKIEQGENASVKNRENENRNGRENILRELAANDGADERFREEIHQKGPAR